MLGITLQMEMRRFAYYQIIQFWSTTIFPRWYLLILTRLISQLLPTFYNMMFVCNWSGLNGPCKQARSIPNTKLVSSSTHFWNHSWQTSPICFPFTIVSWSFNARKGHRNLFCSIWHVSWAYTRPVSSFAWNPLPYWTLRVVWSP